MTLVTLAVGGIFAVLGAAAERLASVWPPDEASHVPPGPRTIVLAVLSGLSGAAIAARSELPWWATPVYLVLLGLMIVLAATDLDQRRLPHVILDPLIVLAAVFVPFNPAVEPLSAVIAAVAAVGFLGALALIVRGGLAVGDLYLVAPIGLMLGWPAIFTALFAGGVPGRRHEPRAPGRPAGRNAQLHPVRALPRRRAPCSRSCWPTAR